MSAAATFTSAGPLQGQAQKEYRRAIYGPVWPNVIFIGLPLLFWVLVGVSLITVFKASGADMPYISRAVLIVVIAGLMSLAARYFLPRILNKISAKRGFASGDFPVRQIQMEITEKGLQTNNGGIVKQVIAWGSFDHLITSENFVYFLYAGETTFIPRAAFGGDEQEQKFIGAARSYIKQAKQNG